MDMKNFEGKVALITGGNSGIGRAAAFAFAKEGARIVIAARRTEKGEETSHEITIKGGECIFIRTDVSKPDEVEALIAKAVEKYGRIDCAFNNAATEGSMKFTADYTEDDFDHIIDVNLKGVWLCLKQEIQQMLKQNPVGGSIVNTSSVNGLGGVAQGALYAASKAGVIALTKSAAQEYAQQRIRVNTLVAGGFQTPMLERVFEGAAEGDPQAAQAVAEQIAQMVPQGRIGKPEEAAEAVIWLCSNAASYVTGHSLIVDGGLTAWAR
jgi:NAD(P)-dependent dehydrogenase (short-subunit alcohol dehydrogenase family)